MNREQPTHKLSIELKTQIKQCALCGALTCFESNELTYELNIHEYDVCQVIDDVVCSNCHSTAHNCY